MLEAFFFFFFLGFILDLFCFVVFFFCWFGLVWLWHHQRVSFEHCGFVYLFLADTVQSWSTLPLALSFGSNLFS